MWGNRLNSRVGTEKMAVRGKLACATYTQTQVYLKPLLRKLKTKSLPEDILDSLTEITSFMLERDYIRVRIGNFHISHDNCFSAVILLA
ncbi:hypothetical protein PR048_007279 [Dryococelus australis]|uniref:Pre-mRNA-splicing factor 18 n=1 Tax=Dryococelus australis TaxID=614101 RepID=A0ABQ9ID65_9NEOP|nr:hypothetical protein PR048_007279 [Dryococelus australis]